MTATARRVLFLGLLAALTVPAGCGPAAGTKQSAEVSVRTADNPWPKLVVGLRANTDQAACRQALNELNGGLAMDPSAPRPASPDPAELGQLAAAFGLTDAERKLLGQTDYGAFDGLFLAESLYLREVARSLGLTDTDPAVARASTAFRWVCRQVVLNPWTARGADSKVSYPPVPPAYILRRGSGSGLERAFVFLAVCRQLDLDAYLIGRAASDRGWQHNPGDTTEHPKGPFWAVGVRDGNTVYLFDPWRGEPLPGKDGKPGTLADARSDAGFAAGWRSDAADPWKVPAADVTGAEAYFSAPLPALARRTALLEAQLKAESGVRLFVSWEAMAKAAEPAAGPVKPWNPPTDGYTPGRVTASFLPTDLGGLDPTPPGNNALYSLYMLSLIPQQTLVTLPPGLKYPEIGTRLRAMAVNGFAATFLDAATGAAGEGGPAQQTMIRERIQRGRYVETTRELVKLRDKFRREGTFLDAVSGSAGKAVEEWVAAANKLHDDLSRARAEPNREARAVRVPEAEQALARFWKDSSTVQSLLTATMLSRPGAAEATYLLACSFHERAEQAQLAAARPAAPAEATAHARDEWGKAAEWWAKYEEYREEQAAGYPGRSEHARRLAARAAAMSGAK